MGIRACCGSLLPVKSNVWTTAIRTIIEVTLVVDSPRFLLVLADISSNGVVIPWWHAHFPLGFEVANLFKTRYKTKICPCRYCRTSLWLSIELLFTFITAIFVEQCCLEEMDFHCQLLKKLEFFIGQSNLIIRDLPNVPVEAVKLLIFLFLFFRHLQQIPDVMDWIPLVESFSEFYRELLGNSCII